MRKDYLTTKEASEYIAEVYERRISVIALRNHIQRGNLKTKQYVKGGYHLIRRGDIETFLKKRNKT